LNKKSATGARTYAAYQLFKGNLDATSGKLSDIQWGDGVNSTGLLTALVTAGYTGITAESTAKDVADLIATYDNNSAELDRIAVIIGNNTNGTGVAFTGGNDTYTAKVSGDGYYFIKETTDNLPGGETASKIMLTVVKDTTIQAKDSVLKPDKKESVNDYNKVADASAAIGDIITFDVEIDIPDTQPYDRYHFVMKDNLPAGLTFIAIKSITAGNYTFTATEGETKGYTATVTPAAVPTFADIENPTTAEIEAAVKVPGDQNLKVVFNEFKNVVETNNLIGQKMTVSYYAIVNDDAVYGPTGNENEVKFEYTNNPSTTHNGDEPTTPEGTTPTSKTRTVVTALHIKKVDGSSHALAGAEFTITGTAYNTTLVKGEKFEKQENGGYWLLRDGSYTNTNPSSVTDKSQYANTEEQYAKVAVDEVVTTPTAAKIVGITNENGELNISGLKPGTYTIEETHAPDGYNKITETKQLIIAWEKKDDPKTEFSIGSGSASEFSMKDNGVCYEITIENQAGTELPSTGGIGTTIFYIAGIVMVLGAAAIVIARRKAEQE